MSELYKIIFLDPTSKSIEVLREQFQLNNDLVFISSSSSMNVVMSSESLTSETVNEFWQYKEVIKLHSHNQSEV